MNAYDSLTPAAPASGGVLERAVAVLASVGDDFLPAVAAELGRSLRADLALIGEVLTDGRIQTLAVWRSGRPVENFTYTPTGLPAARARGEVFYCEPNDRHSCVPREPAFRVERPCAGIVLYGTAGEPVGLLLATLDDGGADLEEASALMTLFAGRVAGELQRARTERELRRHDEHLLQVQRVEAIGRLAGGVAHDFNNLLMIVIGYAELLKERHGESPETHELLAAATRATTLTRQLLAFGRRQVLHAERIDLNQVVTQVQTMLAPVIGGHVRLTADLARELPAIEADPGQIEQVIVNLALNARDAMPDGGDIRFRTSLEDVEQDYHQMPRGSYVCLAIADTGVGMSAEVQAHIFEPFYTTKGPHGTGLGLSSVYGIIKQSGGYIWCTSTPGEGTTFRIYLKPAGTASCRDADRVPAAEPATSTSERVLVVDDEPGVRRLLTRLLGARGYRVVEAADGRAALALLEREAPVDLVVTDLVMPGMDGVALAAAIAERWPQTPVLLMSGFAHRARNDPSFPSALPFLSKPFTAHQLVSAVRAAMKQAKR